MEIYVLGSGSNGNATLIVNQGKLLLIDCGVGIKLLKARLELINVNINDIHDILITHEHSDHIKSLKYFKNCHIYGGCELDDLITINELETFSINGLNITPLLLSHDASKTYGFIIESEDEKLVYITDTGYVKNIYYQYIQNATHYIIESNYDVGMLINSSRPKHLISRIMSNKGHLGNIDCASVIKDVLGNDTKTITLAHISKDCNKENLAIKTFYQVMKENFVDVSHIKVRCASREKLVIVKGSENE